jgi:hypothetical protein
LIPVLTWPRWLLEQTGGPEMIRIKDIKVRHKLNILVGSMLFALMIVTACAYNMLNAVKVNGPAYQKIVSGRDLVADILPPPE